MDLNPNAQKWVDALRSGKYTQAREALTIVRNGEISHCCLGVACELALADGVDISRTERLNTLRTYTEIVYDGSGYFLPSSVADWLGISNLQGYYGDLSMGTDSLAVKNDEGVPFEKIADLIEEHAERLGLNA